MNLEKQLAQMNNATDVLAKQMRLQKASFKAILNANEGDAKVMEAVKTSERLMEVAKGGDIQKVKELTDKMFQNGR